MASSSRVSYPIVWGIVLAMFVVLALGVLVVTRVQTATTPHAPEDLHLQGWQNIVRENPQNSKAQLQLGYAYYMKARKTEDAAEKKTLLEKALACYDVSLKLNPRYNTTQYQRGKVLLELGRVDDALAVFEELVKQCEGRTIATHDAGMIYVGRKQYKKAVPLLEDAVKYNPQAADFRVDLAKAYVAVGKKERAIKALKTALSRYPDNKEAQSMLATLTGNGGK